MPRVATADGPRFMDGALSVLAGVSRLLERRMHSGRKRQKAIKSAILRWYRRNARSFPWRRTRNPYRILLSEVMLQQTQTSRVVEKYPRFLRRFPTFQALARARRSSVIRAWQGMGYNNRAVRLQQLARAVMREHGGRLPRDPQLLQQLPGIGRYTAHAIACFAYGENVPVVDTNVRRVLARLFPQLARNGDIWQLATALLPKQRAYDWNQALFDFGATICTARAPRCATCPVNRCCPSAFCVEPVRPKPNRPELRRNGVPNRIYRGRIIELLRQSRRSLPSNWIGRRIKEDFGPSDRSWLHALLRSLERDGLVTIANGSSTLRVTLAE